MIIDKLINYEYLHSPPIFDPRCNAWAGSWTPAWPWPPCPGSSLRMQEARSELQVETFAQFRQKEKKRRRKVWNQISISQRKFMFVRTEVSYLFCTSCMHAVLLPKDVCGFIQLLDFGLMLLHKACSLRPTYFWCGFGTFFSRTSTKGKIEIRS